MPRNDPVPPQNLEAEESVLGAIMLAPGALLAAAEIVRPSDFYRHSHGKIFEAALQLEAAGTAVDAITLLDFLEQRGELEQIGGRVRVHELAALVPAWKNVGHYARIVREMAILRALIGAGAAIAKLGWERQKETAALVDEAESLLLAATRETVTGEPHDIADILRDGWRKLARLHEEGQAVTGVRSGFPRLDALTTGFQPGDLTIIAARPSMGKTALGLNIAANAALDHATRSLLFSLEMSREQVGQRLMSAEARVESNRLRTGSLEKQDWERLTPACQRLAKLPIHVDDTVMTGLAGIRAKARRLKVRKPDLGLIVVDYLQLIVPREGAEYEALALGEISRGLKALARELEVPVLAMAQLSRKVEERHDKRPNLSDLRGSGSLEQDADIVIFLYRDDYYNPKSDQAGVAEAIVAKQRNGPTDTVKLAFTKRYSRFENLAGTAA